ncbi:META domain-containing protein [Spirosoma pomorum]
MKNVLIFFFTLLLLTQCRSGGTEIDPTMARLMGDWQLNNSTPFNPITLTIALDTANPPHDITPFLASGKGLLNKYTARFYASIDGKISADTFSNTEISGSSETIQAEQAYFDQLARIVRYQLVSENELVLYYGGSQSGSLTFKK